MKAFLAVFGAIEVSVYADTVEEARKNALGHLVLEIEKGMEVYEVEARTERCQICQYTYPPSGVIERDNQQLCDSCYRDKYDTGNISPEDIPF